MLNFMVSLFVFAQFPTTVLSVTLLEELWFVSPSHFFSFAFEFLKRMFEIWVNSWNILIKLWVAAISFLLVIFHLAIESDRILSSRCFFFFFLTNFYIYKYFNFQLCSNENSIVNNNGERGSTFRVFTHKP